MVMVRVVALIFSMSGSVAQRTQSRETLRSGLFLVTGKLYFPPFLGDWFCLNGFRSGHDYFVRLLHSGAKSAESGVFTVTFIWYLESCDDLIL
jgi:hypothetical protein